MAKYDPEWVMIQVDHSLARLFSYSERDAFNTQVPNDDTIGMDARVRRAILGKIDEAISNISEVVRIRESLAGITVNDEDDFEFGIAVGRIYNSFHYQTRRILKRNATGEEFADFLAILSDRSNEIRSALSK
ncbi:MAG TPA: hypothetical protein VIE86_03300 [Nitrososphaera sp.]|jgi:hypothetical protein